MERPNQKGGNDGQGTQRRGGAPAQREDHAHNPAEGIASIEQSLVSCPDPKTCTQP